jgi:hypothetical protein
VNATDALTAEDLAAITRITDRAHAMAKAAIAEGAEGTLAALVAARLLDASFRKVAPPETLLRYERLGAALREMTQEGN